LGMNDAFPGSLLSSFYHRTTPTAKSCTQNLVIFRGSLQPQAVDALTGPANCFPNSKKERCLLRKHLSKQRGWSASFLKANYLGMACLCSSHFPNGKSSLRLRQSS